MPNSLPSCYCVVCSVVCGVVVIDVVNDIDLNKSKYCIQYKNQNNVKTQNEFLTSAVAILLILIFLGSFDSTAETSPYSRNDLSALRHPSRSSTRSSLRPKGIGIRLDGG
jgi:hypothetical protein